MRKLLAWTLYKIGMAYLVASESIQGDGEGPWGAPEFDFRNQFTTGSFKPAADND